MSRIVDRPRLRLKNDSLDLSGIPPHFQHIRMRYQTVKRFKERPRFNEYIRRRVRIGVSAGSCDCQCTALESVEQQESGVQARPFIERRWHLDEHPLGMPKIQYVDSPSVGGRSFTKIEIAVLHDMDRVVDVIESSAGQLKLRWLPVISETQQSVDAFRECTQVALNGALITLRNAILIEELLIPMNYFDQVLVQNTVAKFGGSIRTGRGSPRQMLRYRQQHESE